LITKEFKTADQKGTIQIFGVNDVPEELFSFDNVNERIKKFLSLKIHIPPERIVVLNQIHSSIFYEIPNQLGEDMVGDGLYSTKENWVLVVKTADCMPIFFWSKTEKCFGVLHSGWKGTSLGITEKLISTLKSKNLSNSLEFYLGPCIRKKNYEVGKDVASHFENFEGAISENENGNFQLGLEKVLSETIKNNSFKLEDSQIDVFDDPMYYSHRKGSIGRNLNLIYLVNS
jgi:polyphenol oxidase